jgi:cytochrome c oxidase subunit 2
LSNLIPHTLAFFSPGSGASPNANEINSLYEIILYIALVIFAGVVGTLGYALVKFRARKGAVAQQLHGNTRLEIGWTLGAVGILIVLAVLTFVKLGSITNPPNSGASGDTLLSESGQLYASADRKLPPDGKSLEINVIGRQYIWQFVYPGASNPDGLGAPYSYEEMVVPTETTVTLNVVSDDVVHSWWVPALGGKLQAVPGYHNYGWFKISKPGIYRGQCANICGRGHARMIATVRAVPPAQFDAWLAEQKKLIAESGPGQVENP